MKQKIVMKVTMQTRKKKTKAMQIVVAQQGVASVTIEKENDKMIVTGEGIDAANLVMCLRKKFSYVEIVSVEEVKPSSASSPPPSLPFSSLPWYNPPYPYQKYYEYSVHDPNPSNCSIM